ncbi:alanine racemase [Corynebacterium liangguodongii]|uniref:Alanine racemase n=1 Tax=Corynebacterium liangguodongii TaxID=2079535 RepID=A0A2S0WCC7_9CORY|nr:alanine racemase [Corynebacterium liangguodongii]AWB83418.1 alanine racemase [Corynebacterium liangguodongii]PWC00492.1 alanine racemase [Corynebacterium liangguodongii]
MLTARIDLGAIAHNTRVLKRLAGDARLMCVVKADAYNHGAERVVPVMDAAGADAFGVATLEEAAAVRALTDAPVLAWLWVPGQPIPDGVELGVPTMEHLRWLIDAPSAPPAGTPLHIKVDTGMHRSGLGRHEWDEAFARAAQAGLNVVGLFSHLAVADDPADPYTGAQAESFQEAVRAAAAAGLSPTVRHLANTPALLSRPDLAFDQVRAGLGLYGLEPIAGGDHGLRPAMTWSAPVLAVKRLAAGEPVSYGLTWSAPRDGYTAVIPAGYADGVARSWQGAFTVTVAGKQYPQVGRVCMDQFIVWLGDNEDGVRVGDDAVIFGAGGVSATEFAAGVGTINYEVVCAPKGRTRRVYGGDILAGEKE